MPALPTDRWRRSWPCQVLKGFGKSGLNPKVFMLLLAQLPQFTDPAGAWPITVQTLVLALVHLTTCGMV